MSRSLSQRLARRHSRPISPPESTETDLEAGTPGALSTRDLSNPTAVHIVGLINYLGAQLTPAQQKGKMMFLLRRLMPHMVKDLAKMPEDALRANMQQTLAAFQLALDESDPVRRATVGMPSPETSGAAQMLQSVADMPDDVRLVDDVTEDEGLTSRTPGLHATPPTMALRLPEGEPPMVLPEQLEHVPLKSHDDAWAASLDVVASQGDGAAAAV